MTDAPDYPAAHSMDTIWFAVDSEGRVAQLYSGEGGAAPEGAREGDADGGSYVIREAIAPGSFELVSAARGGRFLEEHNTWWRGVEVVVFVEHESAAQRLVEAGGRFAPADRGFAVVVKQPSEALTALHERGECRGCWPLPDGLESPRVEQNLARYGVYVYSHQLTENQLAGPYSQFARPKRPITIDDVPMLRKLRLFGFPGLFRDTPLLQPFDWWACRADSYCYLMSDLRHVTTTLCDPEDYELECEELRPLFDEMRVKVLRPGEVPAAEPDEP